MTRWTSLDRGGHFAALQAPDLLLRDVRANSSARYGEPLHPTIGPAGPTGRIEPTAADDFADYGIDQLTQAAVAVGGPGMIPRKRIVKSFTSRFRGNARWMVPCSRS